MGSGVVALSAASGHPFVSPDSYVSLYGANLVSTSLVALSQDFPVSLGGVSVQITDSAGNTQTAPLLSVSPNQINFLMPSTVATGQAGISLTTPLGSPILGTAVVLNVAPAIFSANGSGTGVAAATALRVAANQLSPVQVYQCDPNACSSVAIDLRAGGSVYLALYGTGIRRYMTSVACFVHGSPVPVTYAGAQGQFQGMDQVNIGPLPASLNGTGEVSVVLMVDGQTSNAVTVNFR